MRIDNFCGSGHYFVNNSHCSCFCCNPHLVSCLCIGVDYLSVAAWTDLIPSHLVFLDSREIILVEALKLDGIKPGIYSVHCLPLRLIRAEGSPIRCILMK
ncbi:unnamed protein product [Linum tenue]|uniref:Uncharacterized protein n=1 Tax=Linum tenue TaxID=586396 RepID=A0AAV0MHI1_9ROSI|nr:unnamed protein product [Linum tenue]